MAQEVLSDGTGTHLDLVSRFEALNDAMCEDASVWCLATSNSMPSKPGKPRPPKTPYPKCA